MLNPTIVEHRHPLSISSRIANYWQLTKPGILTASLFTTLCGYLLAFPNGETVSMKDFIVLLHTLFGTALVAVGSGSLNMLLEIEIDSQMDRTKNRPLPQGKIAAQEAFFLGAVAASFGIVHLCSMVNLATGFLASLTLVLYLVFYTPLKQKTFFSLFVGAVSGAIPPLIGWTAKEGHASLAGWSLFLILFLWQFPHFLSLSWIYREDYKRANLKVILQSDETGISTGKIAFLFSLILALATLTPYALKLTGHLYLFSSLLLSGLLILASYQFLKDRTQSSAKRLFFTSVAYIPILFILMVLL